MYAGFLLDLNTTIIKVFYFNLFKLFLVGTAGGTLLETQSSVLK